MSWPASHLPRPRSAGAANLAPSPPGRASAASDFHRWQRSSTPSTATVMSTGQPPSCSTPSAPAPAPAASAFSTTASGAGRVPPWQRSRLQQQLRQLNAGLSAVQRTQADTARAAAEAAPAAAEAERAKELEAENIEVSRQILQLDGDLRAAQVCFLRNVCEQARVSPMRDGVEEAEVDASQLTVLTALHCRCIIVVCRSLTEAAATCFADAGAAADSGAAHSAAGCWQRAGSTGAAAVRGTA